MSQRRTYEVADARVSVREMGPADGAPVVLLHGIPASGALWRHVQPLFAAAGLRTYAPDLIGYGATRPGHVADHSLGGSATLLARWIEEEGIGPVWLVGHDLGGAVAQILATRFPTTVGRLTLGDTVAADSWPVGPIKVMAAVAKAGAYPWLPRLGLLPNPYSRWELRKGFADPARLSAVDEEQVFWDGKIHDPDGRGEFCNHLALLDPRQTVEVAPLLRDLTVPSQLVWAAEDRFQPWETVGSTLRGLLPDPAVTVVDDAGHFLPLERPEAYAEALLAWHGA